MDSLIHLLNQIRDLVILTDAQGKILFINAALLQTWEAGATIPTNPDTLIEDLTVFHPQDLSPLTLPELLAQGQIEEGSEPYVISGSLKTQSNQTFRIELSIQSVGFGGEADPVFSVVMWVQQRSEQPLEGVPTPPFTLQDDLTGLLNHHAFEQQLSQTIDQSRIHHAQHVLCHLNLDHFKIVNEACGYEAGNALLHQIAAIIQTCVRRSDLLARLGSDTYGLLLYHCTVDQALNIVNAVRDTVQNFRFHWQDQIFNCSLSIGIVEVNAEAESSSHLMIAADSACRQAKINGRNRSYVYQATDEAAVTHRKAVTWLPRILQALENNQFLLYVQPIVSLRAPASPSQSTTLGGSHEVLIRLLDEEGQLVSPGCFIPVAERYGLMHLVDRWVIRTLFQWLAQQPVWAQPEDHPRCFLYTVNLSGASLNDDEFLGFIQEQFQIYEIPAGLICFEITETLAIQNLQKTRQLIQHLKQIGCLFALDDFGSGMSSFGYLRHLPIDYLKIDGLFVKDLESCQIATEIVESINRIAHVMGIQTIAEFVENDIIRLRLQVLGVDYAQGFGIAKPSPLVNGLG